jgi:hypothetical protein
MFKLLESLPTSLKLVLLAVLIGLAGAAAPANAGPLVEGAKIAEEKAEKTQEWAKKSALPWIKETAVPASIGFAEKLRKAAVEALKKEGE